jgi:dTDP-4-amino-4,6-dideoxygalactose transaminase
MYYILLPDTDTRSALIRVLKDNGFQAVFHYIPLHSSPAGQKFGRVGSTMAVTDSISGRLLRLPMWIGLNKIDEIVDVISKHLVSG